MTRTEIAAINDEWDWFNTRCKATMVCVICGALRHGVAGLCSRHEMVWLESSSVSRARWALQQRVALLMKRLPV